MSLTESIPNIFELESALILQILIQKMINAMVKNDFQLLIHREQTTSIQYEIFVSDQHEISKSTLLLRKLVYKNIGILLIKT